MRSPSAQSAAALLILALLFLHRPAARAETAAETRVLRWKDGRRAVFMLAFDDGCASQLQNVVPELERRRIPGTFYLVTGNNLWSALKDRWTAAAKSPYVVVANHTFTHKGVNSAEELGPELARCNEVLYALHPERRQPRFLPFGKPGGVPWKVTDEELRAALVQHHLIFRPPFAGPPIHYKSAEEMLAVVDRALAKGDVGHLDMHGVGGDWHVTPLDWFTALMEKLDAEREQLWFTDPATLHKYTAERDGAEVRVLEASPDHIRLALTAKTDPVLYDEPLTLATRVPAAWLRCVVTQGASRQEVAVREGEARFAALPGADEIRLEPLPAP